MPKIVELVHPLAHTIIEERNGHILTILINVGASSANWPHDDPDYQKIVTDCGFTDPMSYVFEHEVLHSLIPLRFFNQPGYTIRVSALCKKGNLAACQAEERLIYYVQRWLANGAIDSDAIDPQWLTVRDDVYRIRANDYTKIEMGI